jgi:hypothetical protein
MSACASDAFPYLMGADGYAVVECRLLSFDAGNESNHLILHCGFSSPFEENREDLRDQITSIFPTVMVVWVA